MLRGARASSSTPAVRSTGAVVASLAFDLPTNIPPQQPARYRSLMQPTSDSDCRLSYFPQSATLAS